MNKNTSSIVSIDKLSENEKNDMKNELSKYVKEKILKFISWYPDNPIVVSYDNDDCDRYHVYKLCELLCEYFQLSEKFISITQNSEVTINLINALKHEEKHFKKVRDLHVYIDKYNNTEMFSQLYISIVLLSKAEKCFSELFLDNSTEYYRFYQYNYCLNVHNDKYSYYKNEPVYMIE